MHFNLVGEKDIFPVRVTKNSLLCDIFLYETEMFV